MDGTSVVPVAPGDGGQPGDLRATRRASPSATAAAGPARRGRDATDGGASSSRRPTATYAADALVVAVGVARAAHPARHRHGADPPLRRRPSGRVVRRATGGHPGQAELAASSWPTGCCRGPARSSWSRRRPPSCRSRREPLVGVRARYVQPYEDHVLGGGVSILDAAIDRIERVEGGDGTLAVHLRRTDGGGDLRLEVDDVIAATGFDCPLVDLPASAWPRSGPAGCPARRAWWESTTVPGIWFAGTIGQAAKGLEQARRARPTSGAVHGARYNARVLAERIAETRFGHAQERPAVALDDRRGPRRPRAGRGARAVAPDGLPRPGPHRRPGGRPGRRRRPAAGPLCWTRADRTRLALTLEADGSGAIYPVLYARRGTELTASACSTRPAAALRRGATRARGASPTSRTHGSVAGGPAGRPPAGRGSDSER